MVSKEESQKNGSDNKIATFVAKYGNKGSGANYKGAIEKFLRCIYDKPQFKTVEGKKKPVRCSYDYESLFNEYSLDITRDRMVDVTNFSKYLLDECVSKQSARQVLTYAMRVLRAYRIIETEVENVFGVEDLKREMKGGSATVDRVMSADVICKALRASDVQMRALILFLASSGIRIGELLQIEKSDVDFSMTPVMITVRAEIAKNKQQRFSFISNEAMEAYREYDKARNQFIESAERRTAILASTTKNTSATANKNENLLFPMTDGNVNKKWETLLKKAGLYAKDRKSQRNVLRIHGLRKFFISSLSLAGAKVLAEHLAGHTGYLDQSYRQVSPEFAAREYQKLQSHLVCCIPEAIKQREKIQDEKIVTLLEKTEMQGMGYEGLKLQNQELRQRLNDVESKMSIILEYIQNSTAAPAAGEQIPLSAAHSKITHE